MDKIQTIDVRKQPDGSYVADRPARPGTPPIGRGATWLEALGDYFIQNVDTYGAKAVVFDESGEPVPPEFFGPQHRRDA